MRFKLLQYIENLYSSYWVIPSIFSLISILLAVLVLKIDEHYSLTWSNYLYFVHGIELPGSQMIFSTVASSIITITSVVFSITMLILSLASNQLGPRLLTNFMKQGRTQVVLGIFTAIFIYSVMSLLCVSAIARRGIPLYLPVAVELVLAIVAVFVLIYFIQYVSHIIKVDNVLSFLSNDMVAVIKRQLKKRDVKDNDPEANHYKSFDIKSGCKLGTKVRVQATGYIQTAAYNKLLAIAKNHDLKMQVLYKPGDFVFKNLPIVDVFCKKELKPSICSEIRGCFYIGARRTVVQDIEFAFEQVAEIAVRALSPGINNPYTAINCLDQLAYGISVLNEYEIPSNIMLDDEKIPRVKLEQFTYVGIIDNALHRFRQQAVDDLLVAIHWLDVIYDLLQIDLISPIQNALYNQAELVYKACLERKFNEADKHDLELRFNNIQNKIFGRLY